MPGIPVQDDHGINIIPRDGVEASRGAACAGTDLPSSNGRLVCRVTAQWHAQASGQQVAVKWPQRGGG
eukprot:364792-Chlamydomonas_euryale.AAC.16